MIALGIAFSGCVLVSGFTGGSMAPIAILTGIGSGVGYALYSIFGSVALKRYRPFTVIFYTFFIASIGILPLTDAVGTWNVLSRNMGNLAFAEPMVATLAGIVIFHEALQMQNVLGIGMILAAIVLLGRK